MKSQNCLVFNKLSTFLPATNLNKSLNSLGLSSLESSIMFLTFAMTFLTSTLLVSSSGSGLFEKVDTHKDFQGFWVIHNEMDDSIAKVPDVPH